jgi:hypothetical protein
MPACQPSGGRRVAAPAGWFRELTLPIGDSAMSASFSQAPRKLGARLASLHKRFVEANPISNAASTRFYLVSAAIFAALGFLSWLWQLYHPVSPRPGGQPPEAQRAAPEPAGPPGFRPGSNRTEDWPASPESVREAIRPGRPRRSSPGSIGSSPRASRGRGLSPTPCSGLKASCRALPPSARRSQAASPNVRRACSPARSAFSSTRGASRGAPLFPRLKKFGQPHA